ncbi:MAG: hypothetical protein PVTTEEND_000690 [Candidatus Fervidibacter sp.]
MAVRDHEKEAARCNPFWCNLSAKETQVNICSIASASARQSFGGTKRAAPPAISLTAGASPATTGVPHAIASKTGSPNPS